MKRKILTVHDMCEIAILTGIAIILGFFVEIKVQANGGSIGVAMVPLFLIAYRHGFIKGFIAGGIIYGFAQCLYDAYGFACYPLDYLLPFGAIGIAGLFRKFIFSENGDIIKGVKPYLFIVISQLIVCVIRFFSHTLSGVILWETEFVASMVYQTTYVIPTCILCIIVFCALYYPLAKINKRYPAGR